MFSGGVSIPYRHLINWKKGKIGGGEEKVSIPYRHLINSPDPLPLFRRLRVSIPYRHLINEQRREEVSPRGHRFQSLIGT